jgi:thioredoxin 1
VIESDKPALVVFASKSCGPCFRALDLLNDLGPAYKGKVQFYKVEVPQSPALTRDYEIQYTPTLIMFQNGKSIGQRRAGVASSDLLMKFFDRGLNLVATNLVKQLGNQHQELQEPPDKQKINIKITVRQITVGARDLMDQHLAQH